MSALRIAASSLPVNATTTEHTDKAVSRVSKNAAAARSAAATSEIEVVRRVFTWPGTGALATIKIPWGVSVSNVLLHLAQYLQEVVGGPPRSFQ